MNNKNYTYEKLIIEYLKINGKSKIDDLFEHVNTNKEFVGKTGKQYLREVVTSRYQGSDIFEYENPYVWLKNNDEQIENIENASNDIPENYEGELRERKILSRKRNIQIVKESKKRDKYTCLACEFYYNDLIVEAHHLSPLSNTGETIVNKDNLITLCPNCHAIAHYLLKKDSKYINKNSLLEELKKLCQNP